MDSTQQAIARLEQKIDALTAAVCALLGAMAEESAEPEGRADGERDQTQPL